MKYFIYVFLLILSTACYAQEVITGKILAVEDNVPIENASIYFNNTTTGTISDTNGDFVIERSDIINTELVISVLGFETLVIPYKEQQAIKIIYLKESLESLDEVVLDDDTWSRERKLREFKKHFLGSFVSPKDVKILNEEDIRLRYSGIYQTLYADSPGPIKIRNKRLGYLISYDLLDFEATYEKNMNGFIFGKKSFFAGTVFFENLKDKPSRKVLKNRTVEYKGSLLHFLRSLRDQQLVEEKYRVFKGSYESAPYAPFQIVKEDNSNLVTLLDENIQILYNDTEQSKLMAISSFSIDEFGNHSPVGILYTSGAMAERKVAAMLPLTYKLKE